MYLEKETFPLIFDVSLAANRFESNNKSLSESDVLTLPFPVPQVSSSPHHCKHIVLCMVMLYLTHKFEQKSLGKEGIMVLQFVSPADMLLSIWYRNFWFFLTEKSFITRFAWKQQMALF